MDLQVASQHHYIPTPPDFASIQTTTNNLDTIQKNLYELLTIALQ
jgi:hypothetical protein